MMNSLNGISNLRPVCRVRKSMRLLQRDDPAVQQIARRHALAPEVVDDEHAAVGLHLDRRFVEPGDRVERQVEHVERQLAADHDHGRGGSAPSGDPAPPPLTTLCEASVAPMRTWCTGSNMVIVWPSTSIANGTYMLAPCARPMPLGDRPSCRSRARRRGTATCPSSRPARAVRTSLDSRRGVRSRATGSRGRSTGVPPYTHARRRCTARGAPAPGRRSG